MFMVCGLIYEVSGTLKNNNQGSRAADEDPGSRQFQPTGHDHHYQSLLCRVSAQRWYISSYFRGFLRRSWNKRAPKSSIIQEKGPKRGKSRDLEYFQGPEEGK